MQIGIRAQDLGGNNLEEIIKNANFYGIKCLQLPLSKIIKKEQITNENIFKISQILKENKIKTSLLSAYFNPVHSDKTIVSEGIEYFEKMIKNVKKFNCDFVGSETGSYNDNKWTYNEKNHTKEAFSQVVKIFSKLAEVAEKNDVCIAIEMAYEHVIYSPKIMADLIKQINKENIRVIVDPYNLVDKSNKFEYLSLLEESFKLFGDKICLIHCKDMIIENEKKIQVGIGKGIFDYKEIKKILIKYKYKGDLILEGESTTNIINALDELKKAEF